MNGDLWQRVQERLQAVRQAYGASDKQKRPRGQAPEMYSPHLLSGLIRCDICGARITIQTSQRKKNGVAYRYGRYRCSFHVTKGPAVCSNSMSIREDVLDAKLLEKFQTALTPEMIDDVVTATNTTLRQFHGATPQEISTLIQERQQIERELSNLVEFVAKGDLSSPRLRDEIRAREQRLAELDQQLDRLRATAAPAPGRSTGRGSRNASRSSMRCWPGTRPGRGEKFRSTSRICGSRRPPRWASASSGSPGTRNSTASSEPRRPCAYNWLRGSDLNRRPLGYEPNELPGCSTPR